MALDAVTFDDAVILINGCDWTMVLAMVQCNRLPEELISVPVVWLLGSEGADAIAVAETFHALEECFCKCQEAQMQYKIRLAPTHARSVRYYWGRQLWLMSHLWKRWVEEYLVTLTTREKWTKIRLQSENGDIVFLVEEGVTGGSWVRSWRRCRGVTVSPGQCGCGLPEAFGIVRVDHLFFWNQPKF
ncbi:hypothetical protein T12_7542 [Trichinella patagoniensis]|uniref:DUF5641 domain-containing protein n=1 Tax=Trichinella patagoniensis TaxID=990121 RepID=A0A0V1ADX1_9BILA|nr:hypothetical protein T12_7542 [Trichinella patagoniensis]